MALLSDAEVRTWFQAARGVLLTAPQLQFLGTIRGWVESAINRVVGYPLVESTYTEFLAAAGGERPPLEFGIDVGWDRIGTVVMPRSRVDQAQGYLQLTRLPVRAVTSVYENLAAWTTGATNGNWPEACLLPATAYRLDMAVPDRCDSGRLVRVVGCWASSPRSVKVTYTAGLSGAEIEADHGQVKAAALDSLGWWWQKAMVRSASIKSNMLTALQLTVRDFSVTLGDPAKFGAGDGAWAHNVLSPFALNVLAIYATMTKYFR